MLSILKLDSILLTLLSTVIRVSFPLSLSQKGICSSIVYHKTLHLYCKFSYYEERTYNLLRYHYHFKSSIFATFIHLLLLNYLKNKELNNCFPSCFVVVLPCPKINLFTHLSFITLHHKLLKSVSKGVSYR